MSKRRNRRGKRQLALMAMALREALTTTDLENVLPLTPEEEKAFRSLAGEHFVERLLSGEIKAEFEKRTGRHV